MNRCKKSREPPHAPVENGSADVKDRKDKEGSENNRNQNPCHFITWRKKMGESDQERIEGMASSNAPISGKDLPGMKNIGCPVIVNHFRINEKGNSDKDGKNKKAKEKLSFEPFRLSRQEMRENLFPMPSVVLCQRCPFPRPI